MSEENVSITSFTYTLVRTKIRMYISLSRIINKLIKQDDNFRKSCTLRFRAKAVGWGD